MRAVVDARSLSTAYERRGVGYYTRMLLRRLPVLAPDIHFVFFLGEKAARAYVPDAPNAEAVVLRRSWKRAWAEDCLRLPGEIRRAGGGLFHCPVVLGPLRSINIPLRAGVPVISTVHDLHVETLDDPVMRAYRGEMRYTVQSLAVRRTHIVTDSEFTKMALVERGIEGVSGITVVPVCSDECPLPENAAKDNLVLYIGDAPHKNPAAAIRVFKALSDRAPDWRYVMVGSRERIFSLGGLYAKELQSAGILQIEEDAPDEILQGLFARAAILFMPSLSEGFGVPVLQAFAARAAAVISDRGSLPEVGGDAAAVVDPDNPEEMISTLEGLMKNPSLREELARRGAERLKKFDYRVHLKRLVDLYKEVAGGGA